MKQVEESVKQCLTECAKIWGERYGFSAEEAICMLSEKKVTEKKVTDKKVTDKKVTEKKVTEKKVASIKLPFVGVIDMERCQGVRKNEGLYNQCEGEKAEGEWCVRCVKEGKKNGRGKPDEGSIEERKEKGEEYRSEKGEIPVAYLKIMRKKGWCKEEVEEEAKRQGVVLPEWVWNDTKKGRPKKEKTEEKEAKKGRPKKEKKIEIEKEDLFVKLMKEAAAKEEVEQEAKEEVEVEVEEISVKKEIVNGKTYLRSKKDNRMYDEETEDEIGIWNEELKEIEYY